MDNPDKLLEEIKTDISGTASLKELENVKIKHFGRDGTINSALRNISSLPIETRKEFGKKINEIKTLELFDVARKRTEHLAKEENTQYVDITLPGKKCPKGSLHMTTLAIEEITSIFERLGFIRMSYPEVEWEYFSFDTLNMPPHHPARDDFETFFIDTPAHPEYGKMVLTPHTSSGQNREMKRLGKPPIRMINLAKTYRPNWDASHVPMFHQFEGLCVDKDINITHLKGTIDYFAKSFFGKNRNTRLRPFHFQFTEPSFEVDITCDVCEGTGFIQKALPVGISALGEETEKCKLCKSGWLELGGAGMVHPNVLKAGGINPKEYTGWAFGIGVERVMMMKEGLKLDDIRIMYGNDVRFLEQF